MTETDDKSAHGGEPAVPPRRQLLFARLAAAIRRQDWFVVALEVAIVVLGVVIGFQVTAWGQARADRAQERAYLSQLAEDARETVRRIDHADSTSLLPALRKSTLLLRSFRLIEPPPRDSFLTWLVGSYTSSFPSPVTATAEAITQSGHLALIQSDSLRRALPAYLERSTSRIAEVRLAAEANQTAYRGMSSIVDGWEAFAETRPPAILDSLANLDTFPIPAGARKTPFPFTVEELLRNRELYLHYNTRHTMLRIIRRQLQESRGDAVDILRLVEAAQGETER